MAQWWIVKFLIFLSFSIHQKTRALEIQEFQIRNLQRSHFWSISEFGTTEISSWKMMMCPLLFQELKFLGRSRPFFFKLANFLQQMLFYHFSAQYFQSYLLLPDTGSYTKIGNFCFLKSFSLHWLYSQVLWFGIITGAACFFMLRVSHKTMLLKNVMKNFNEFHKRNKIKKSKWRSVINFSEFRNFKMSHCDCNDQACISVHQTIYKKIEK